MNSNKTNHEKLRNEVALLYLTMQIMSKYSDNIVRAIGISGIVLLAIQGADIFIILTIVFMFLGFPLFMGFGYAQRLYRHFNNNKDYYFDLGVQWFEGSNNLDVFSEEFAKSGKLRKKSHPQMRKLKLKQLTTSAMVCSIPLLGLWISVPKTHNFGGLVFLVVLGVAIVGVIEMLKGYVVYQYWKSVVTPNILRDFNIDIKTYIDGDPRNSYHKLSKEIEAMKATSK